MTGNYLPCPCSSEIRNANQKRKRGVLECPNTPKWLNTSIFGPTSAEYTAEN
ncbi:hypothetical protein PanWU01x14_033960 [Parasponia andersonii]|uniref:Uncharacterized protein n=1 Tax=Parasponia andersonii TaxID=3476 RepID=A0A2P5DTV1_PARAD|nr:hypothetical protein PanWU01x14_033960 [Parasponia andersonii]